MRTLLFGIGLLTLGFGIGTQVGFNQAPELSESPCCNRPLTCPVVSQWQTDALEVCQMILRQSLATSNACITRLEAERARGGGL